MQWTVEQHSLVISAHTQVGPLLWRVHRVIHQQQLWPLQLHLYLALCRGYLKNWSLSLFPTMVIMTMTAFLMWPTLMMTTMEYPMHTMCGPRFGMLD